MSKLKSKRSNMLQLFREYKQRVKDVAAVAHVGELVLGAKRDLHSALSSLPSDSSREQSALLPIEHRVDMNFDIVQTTYRGRAISLSLSLSLSRHAI